MEASSYYAVIEILIARDRDVNHTKTRLTEIRGDAIKPINASITKLYPTRVVRLAEARQ